MIRPLLLLLFLLPGCGSDAALRAVHSHGFTDVQLTGQALLGCSEEDSALSSYTFVATNTERKPISGRVCCGLLFRGCTVRF